MSKTTHIDLSKVKIGQKVKLRNGEIVTFEGKNKSRTYPYLADPHIYTKQGTFWPLKEKTESSYDIIKILPLPKKKTAKNPAEKMSVPKVRDELTDWIESAHKRDAIRTVINILESILK